MHDGRYHENNYIGIWPKSRYMVRQSCVFNGSKKGFTTLGTIILLIAFTLVALVAVATYYSVASGIQGKSQVTAQVITTEITTKPHVMKVSGTDGTNGDLENLFLYVRANTGGNTPIDLRKMAVTVSRRNRTDVYAFSALGPSTDRFNITYIDQGPDWLQYFMGFGDVVCIDLILAVPISNGEEISIALRPSKGATGMAEFNTPESIAVQYIQLYP
ncbi:hypothetical protein COV93_04995 [Candidatus Woesearchaeota archaeon CG11_big_fil_rev_8_21_14_0_20_43_8]|nr:MAG: hypothetical protein COV93_04995 [Candidatus Woesearchaeota archaeon CG11_big_fil_rev_8_21_14_0_20_43_8]